MNIRYSGHFLRQFRKLPESEKQKTTAVIKRFACDPLDPRLHNHPLSGQMQGKRAIKVTADIRAIFEQFEHYTLVVFLDVGGHDRVYK